MKAGLIFTIKAPLHASNVQVVDPVTGRPCKCGVKYLEDGTKVESSKRHRSIRIYSYEKSEGHKTLRLQV
ncbi:putative ribosomal protein L24 [Rosa chinensis]|uniref:Putative ribosomal protein L24 n=1 Tax=Rosa chinensis TaxID=74649 RepID=A0A2P6PGR2_ROSCH|nr:putative ribosomal protein L24 [Rosa chinensis]